MIAAQLLAYYFTELKDDQVKKVSAASIFWQYVCLLYVMFMSESDRCEEKAEVERRWEHVFVEVIEFTLSHHHNFAVRLDLTGNLSMVLHPFKEVNKP